MMRARLLSPRECVFWTAAFVLVAALIVATHFSSTDPDSQLYASISGRLSEEPVSHWIAPEWWDFWPETHMTGLFREHPAGVFLVPVALSRLGIPGERAAYIAGVGAGLASLLLIAVLIGRLASVADGRASLILLQLMPVAFLFRVRANHEYPMLVALLVTILSVEGARRSWWWIAGIAFGLTLGLLVKGVFVALVVLAAGLWILLNPTRLRGTVWRVMVACVAGAAITAGIAVLYDIAYVRATGEAFWAAYWVRQLGPVTIATPLDNASTLAGHLAFYLTRLLWFPAPWSLALLAGAWHLLRDRPDGQRPSSWARLSPTAKRGLIFALGFAALAVLLLSPSSRFAERYTFSAAYMIGAAGVVVALRTWSGLSRAVMAIDARVPALPAVVWLVLMLLRIVIGPWLPRIA
jgi:4-amino-4-deoxy-L-arabinose transferase-like glycosyltransferase